MQATSERLLKTLKLTFRDLNIMDIKRYSFWSWFDGNNRLFIDDFKATNSAAFCHALYMFNFFIQQS
jgi:hypothetical protein